MKLYVTRWHCTYEDIRLEYRSGDDFVKFTETGPLCSECAHKLRPDTSTYFVPDVIVDFTL